MAREQFEAANALIKAKRYDEARKLLNTINHPKAKEWLARLDTIAPRRRGVNPIAIGLIVVFIAAFAAFGFYIYSTVNEAKESEQARIDVILALAPYCRNNAQNPDQTCSTYLDAEMQNDAQYSVIQACFERYDNDDLISSCLAQGDIPLP